MLDLQQKKADLEFGFQNELEILGLINDIIPDTYKTENTYNNFDFRNDRLKIDFELKSRRIYKGQYRTVYFANCKLDKGRENLANGESRRVIYLFDFVAKNDRSKRELWFWEDDGSDVELTMGGNFARNDYAKPLVNIPMDKLQSRNVVGWGIPFV